MPVEHYMKKYFGFTAFKPGQEEIIASIRHNCDTLAILPTGGGKSLCYQLPALMLPGLTLVISPLIALMKDQVDALNIQGIAASFINSSLSGSEVRYRSWLAAQGRYRLLYMAPERLQSEELNELLQKISLSLVAVDEAHCISQWGHDFRPSYRNIGAWVATLRQRPLMAAFTATATPQVREDIIHGLGLQQPRVFTNSFDRPNLHFSVVKTGDRKRFIKRYLQEHPAQAGIIYAATRKEVEQLHHELHRQGFKVAKYHAGMNSEDRSAAQDDFIYDRVQAIVATNAFGLGIDKSNAAFVIHHNMPRHLEAYYQEAGRAGRDGERADCILLFQAADIQVQKHLIEQSILSERRKEIEYVKLQRMTDYCHTSACLRAYILEYFGETPIAASCPNCSNCTDYEIQDVTIEAQKVFSCIYRMKQQYGSSLVAAVLNGSKQKRVLKLGFDRLSTYGIMSDWNSARTVEFIHQLVAEEYLAVSGGQYPVLKLTPKAIPVLRSQEKLLVRMPPQETAVSPDNSIFEALRLLRHSIAQAEQVPPYVVFSDATLREMAQYLPQDRDAMLEITGVGEIKLEKYGRLFLDKIREFVEDQPTPAPSATPPAEPEPPRERHSVTKTRSAKAPREEKTPTYLLSWQLYQQGQDVASIAKQRQRSIATIQGHLIEAVRQGYEVNWDEFINRRQEQQIVAAARKLGTDKLKPLKEILPEEIDYFMIKIALFKNELEPSQKDSGEGENGLAINENVSPDMRRYP